MKAFRIAVFASGNGTNAEAIFRHFKDHPAIEVSLLLTNNPQAFALERARRNGVPHHVFDRAQFKDGTIVLDWLKEHRVTHIVLAGFLWLIPQYLIQAFPRKIINIHPALLPLFGGKGMYGIKVHEAVKTSGVSETGITIHLVDDRYDEGEIVFQAKCPVSAGASADEIGSAVHALEYKHYPQVIENWILSKP
jgi:phosphoribosylglycinamide formyltransferase 1